MEIKLSKTSKMNCNSWSTQALETCNRGAKLACKENSVCSLCYACSGAYHFPSTVNRRKENLEQYLSNRNGWISSMVNKLSRIKNPLFRWFDSGDLRDIDMLKAIIEIAILSPEKSFWLPTRETGIIREYIESVGVPFPSNLNIRISADFIGKDPVNFLYFHKHGCTFSTVETDMERTSLLNRTACHATIDNSGKCGNCKKCWSKTVDCISYKLH